MNISINGIAYDVIEKYRANYKDTDALDIRQVYHWVNTARAFLIKQRLDKNIFEIYEEEIQRIPSLELEETAGSTGTVQTTIAIPVTINRKGYHGTLTKVSEPYITSVDNDYVFAGNPVQVVSPTRFKRVGNRKFNGNFYYATIARDNKLYFKTYTIVGADYISAEGVFQNPIEVMVLNSVADPYNADYPINENLIKDLTNLIVSENFQLILQQIEDKIGEDGRDSTTK